MRVDLKIQAVLTSKGTPDQMIDEILNGPESEVNIFEVSSISPLIIGKENFSVIHSYSENYIIRKPYKEVQKEIYHNKRIK